VPVRGTVGAAIGAQLAVPDVGSNCRGSASALALTLALMATTADGPWWKRTGPLDLLAPFPVPSSQPFIMLMSSTAIEPRLRK
jgi:hypothetical protein